MPNINSVSRNRRRTLGTDLERGRALEIAERESVPFTTVFCHSAIAMRDLCLLESENEVYVFPDGKEHYTIFVGSGRQLTEELDRKAGESFSHLHQAGADVSFLQALEDVSRLEGCIGEFIDEWIREWTDLMIAYNAYLVMKKDLAEDMDLNKHDELTHNDEGLRLSLRFRVMIIWVQGLIEALYALFYEINYETVEFFCMCRRDPAPYEQVYEQFQSMMRAVERLLMALSKSSRKREERQSQLIIVITKALENLARDDRHYLFIGETEGCSGSYSDTIPGFLISRWARFKLREGRVDDEVNLCLLRLIGTYLQPPKHRRPSTKTDKGV